MVPGRGTIEGLVLDEAAKPVEGAVLEYETLGRINTGLVVRFSTNGRGEFLIDNAPVGQNRLCGWKEADGYPDPLIASFSSAAIPCSVAAVKEGQTTKDVLIRLGPRAARLKGWVIDALTGNPIWNASLGIFSADASREVASVGPDKKGRFDVLAPIDKPFRFRVFAWGYRLWYYGPDGSEAKEATLRLASNETKELEIRLQPTAAAPRP